ncbi:MAG: hypothetical protein OIF47_01620 [Marinibacterium sp.]|nr:hypothetical protein [Marinibacterium sp.]
MTAPWRRPHPDTHSHHSHPDDRRVEDCGFDTFETNLLEIARYVLLSFSAPESHAWIEAFRIAETRLTPPFGATIAHAMVITLNKMRVSRAGVFNYINPECTHCSGFITNEERYLFTALQAVRQGRRGVAETHCMLLCEGGDTGPLMAALERVAVLTGDVDQPRGTLGAPAQTPPYM